MSYLEIYNQTGFDLLDPNREIKAMEDLPQVRAGSDSSMGQSLIHPWVLQLCSEHLFRGERAQP